MSEARAYVKITGNGKKELLGCEYPTNGNDDYPRALRIPGGSKGKADQGHESAKNE
jgi:hypothetical protein